MTKHLQKKCKKHGMCKHVKRKDSKTSYRCTKCMSNSVSLARRKLKEKAIEYKGGKCHFCGYKKSSWSLEFHHVDPAKKDFTLGKSSPKKWETIKLELDKCILVCRNCHGEIHEKMYLQSCAEFDKK